MYIKAKEQVVSSQYLTHLNLLEISTPKSLAVSPQRCMHDACLLNPYLTIMHTLGVYICLKALHAFCNKQLGSILGGFFVLNPLQCLRKFLWTSLFALKYSMQMKSTYSNSKF